MVVARSTLRAIAMVVVRSTLRAIAFTKKLRYAPFFRSHPSPLLTPFRRPFRQLRWSSRGRRCGRLRSRKNSAALRFSVHIHRPYSRRSGGPSGDCDGRRGVVATKVKNKNKKSVVNTKKYRELPFTRSGSLSNSSHYAYFKVLEKLRIARD
jgi:hypothetical protein